MMSVLAFPLLAAHIVGTPDDVAHESIEEQEH
jgi:hypothetical protein